MRKAWTPKRIFPALALLAAWLTVSPVAGASPGPAAPGVVIDYSPASSRIYIGSPSIAMLSKSDYVASHDEFGPGSAENTRAVTKVFASRDRGRSWTNIARIDGQFWSTLFAHHGALYLLGTDKHHGQAIIRRSTDRGRTWSSPLDAATGLLRAEAQYHCAPVPVLEHAGRLWRAMEHREPAAGWGVTYCAGLLSAAVDADLLKAANWTFSNFLPADAKWLSGSFGGWLEGNAVVTPDGRLVDLLRVDTPGLPEKAALVLISPDGSHASFDPVTGFVDFPGGAKKFTLRFDPRSGLYWSITSIVQPQDEQAGRPGSIRNSLALTSSPDLAHWTIRRVLLHHPDTAKHGFQYVDWLFDDADLIAVCRTAGDDGQGGAHSYHDANYLTFHRVMNFRAQTP
jgi:hypothetical protein